jgi:hypothetical protein
MTSNIGDVKNAQFVDTLSLSNLHRLTRMIASLRDDLSWLGLKFNEDPPLPEELDSLFSKLESEFPGLKEVVDFRAARNAVVHAYTADDNKRIANKLAELGEQGTPLDRDFTNRMLYRDESVKLLIVDPLMAVSAAAAKRIKSDNWNALDKAHQYLVSHVLADVDRYGDLEAVVYMRSRGGSCPDLLDEINDGWRRAANNAIEEFARGYHVRSFGDEQDGETEYVSRRPLEEAADVARWSPSQLRNFWGGHDHEELTIDATMLRAMHWCGIGGFEVWWRRWADDVADSVAHGGIENGPAGAIWLFALVRSDKAIELLGLSMGTALWALQLGQYDKHRPWFILREKGSPEHRYFGHDTCPPIAATIIFGSARLGGISCNQNTINAAAEFLVSSQRADGEWRWFDAWDRPSIESTAMAVHALVLHKPHGWENAVRRAKKWLLSSQKSFGYWYENGASGAAPYLTALVMDAIELANGGACVTFDFGRIHELSTASTHVPDRDQAMTTYTETIIVEKQNVYNIKHSRVGIAGNVVGSTIADSFNQAAGRTHNNELKRLLSELKELIEQLAGELPHEDVQTLARDYADLAQESSSKEPRKNRLKVTAEGLIEAAKTCAQLTGPITATVKAIVDLFK